MKRMQKASQLRHNHESSVRNLYDQQDKVMKVLAHRIVDGSLQKARAQKSFANDQGVQIQYPVEWANSVVHKEHLQILDNNVYRALSSRMFTQLGFWPSQMPE